MNFDYKIIGTTLIASLTYIYFAEKFGYLNTLIVYSFLLMLFVSFKKWSNELFLCIWMVINNKKKL